jgi:hypothetical protein
MGVEKPILLSVFLGALGVKIPFMQQGRCKDEKFLHRYETEQEMYKTCDIVIDLIDCAFWEVYSQDHSLLYLLKNKFKKIEFLEAIYSGLNYILHSSISINDLSIESDKE